MVDISRDMKLVDRIIVHCSDSDYPEHDNVETIRKWHVDEKKWSDIGYHYFIDKKGKIWPCRDIRRSGAHWTGQNLKSIGICLSGRREFFEPQMRSAHFLIKDLMRLFKISKANVFPHNYFVPMKTCPNFSLDRIWMFD